MLVVLCFVLPEAVADALGSQLAGDLVFAGLFVHVPVAVGVAILKYHLYDIDRLINRILVYGLLTGLLAGVYAGVVLLLGQVFGGIGDQPPSWVVAGATLAVAALFQPARRRIQAVVDRRFNRRKYDAAGPSRRSAPACVTRSTWTRSPPSCWPSLTKPCSQRRLPYGSDQRHSLRRVVNGEQADGTPTRLDPCMPCSFGLLPTPGQEPAPSPTALSK